jgi:diguanylate cyclase (GGDEF)-like protein
VSTIRKRVASLLEWSAVDKSLFVIVTLLVIVTGYMGFAYFAMNLPDADRLVNAGPIRELIGVQVGVLLGCLLIIGACLALRRRRPDALWLQHIATQFYSLSLVVNSYYIGTMAFCTGVVLLGAPVFGLILLERRVVWFATINAVLLLLGLSYATAYGLIPYAPVVVPPTDAYTNLWWMTTIFFFTAPNFFVILLFADQMVNFWRNREDTIRMMSRTDMLTGIANRRSIMEQLNKEIARTFRHGPPVCLVLLDLDHFKKINDTHGHPTGDKVLREAARVLRASIRTCDVVGRYGGEEFMLILPDTTLEGATILLERCRAQLAATVIRAETGKAFHVTASFGVVCNEKNMATDPELLIKIADEALYRAKENGRNRVEVAETAVA